MKEVVIVGALRTPIGCFQGTLARHSAVELGSMVVRALLERTGVPSMVGYPIPSPPSPLTMSAARV